ncbi:DDE-type integrase/transposase/recombinase [Pseudomonas sp. PDM19]
MAAGIRLSPRSADCTGSSRSPVRQDHANRHWVSDMPHARTAQVWLYLAVVLDLYSRAVVDWAVQQALVHAALEIAVARRQPQAEMLLHSGRGSQYCTYGYQALLRRHRIAPSYSQRENCWDTQFTVLLNVSPI